MGKPSNNLISKDSAGEITLLLSDLRKPESLRTVIGLAYGDFHKIAHGYIRNEPPACTLETTDLVHEACHRLLEADELPRFENRSHFFCAGAQIMRWVLVDHARRRKAEKRGSGWRRVDFSVAERIGFDHPAELIDCDESLTRLQEFKPRWARIAELHIFGGFSNQEAGDVLGIAAATAKRDWTEAKRWLKKDLAEHSSVWRRNRKRG
jgi:RNA polymerase sigma factor (TIGR02999 family)